MLNVDRHAQPIGWRSIRGDVLLYMQARQGGDVEPHLAPSGPGGIGFSVVLCHPENGGTDLPLTARCSMNKKVSPHRYLNATEVQLRLLPWRLDELKRGELVRHGLDGV